MTKPKDISVGSVTFGAARPFALIAGPCQMESRQHAYDMCGAVKEIAGRLGIGFVYKSSYDKANRTSGKGARGVGIEKAMPISVCRSSQMCMSRIIAPKLLRSSTSCKYQPSFVARQTCWSRPQKLAASST
jgi:3-deoxy-D-manno-octulosonic acid (KDO) 8-phosphate synthase